jgi:hypothetical protein
MCGGFSSLFVTEYPSVQAKTQHTGAEVREGRCGVTDNATETQDMAQRY